MLYVFGAKIWGEASMQAALKGCKQNKQVYKRIVLEMRAVGYNRTFICA